MEIALETPIYFLKPRILLAMTMRNPSSEANLRKPLSNETHVIYLKEGSITDRSLVITKHCTRNTLSSA